VLADSAALAEDGVEAIALEIEELPVVADRHISAWHETLLFEEASTNLAMKFTAICGDADAAFHDADYTSHGRFSWRDCTPVRGAGGAPRWRRRCGMTARST
jgi:carbon-monoxide dehydrogenase large subunit